MKSWVDFEVRSAVDELLYTSPHRDLAMREARRLMVTHPGVGVEEVHRIENRRRIWTDRASMRAPAQHEPEQQGVAA